jgi:hypothetical protein
MTPIKLSGDRVVLTVQQCAVDFMVEEGFASTGIQAYEQYLIDTAMRAIRISFKYPAKVLQTDREIARYPATLWSHFFSVIGLRRYARYNVVLLNEHLAFPHVEIPPELKIGATVVYNYRDVGTVGDTQPRGVEL